MEKKTNRELFSSMSYGDLKALKQLEKKAHKWAEDSCNYQISDTTETRRHNIIVRDIERIFGQVPEGFFINGDPRGYALKIDPEKGDIGSLERDWGGYGLLAKSS